MIVSRMVLSAALIVSMAGFASAKQPTDEDRMRAEAEHICFDDVQKLCADVIPDEEQIKSCMGQKRAQLSPACGKIFDRGLKGK